MLIPSGQGQILLSNHVRGSIGCHLFVQRTNANAQIIGYLLAPQRSGQRNTRCVLSFRQRADPAQFREIGCIVPLSRRKELSV